MSHRADIMIHIDETLDDQDLISVEKSVAFEDGVYSACVNCDHRHLMLVDYDPDITSSSQVLHTVTGQGWHAEMIGI